MGRGGGRALGSRRGAPRGRMRPERGRWRREGCPAEGMHLPNLAVSSREPASLPHPSPFLREDRLGRVGKARPRAARAPPVQRARSLASPHPQRPAMVAPWGPGAWRAGPGAGVGPAEAASARRPGLLPCRRARRAGPGRAGRGGGRCARLRGRGSAGRPRRRRARGESGAARARARRRAREGEGSGRV